VPYGQERARISPCGRSGGHGVRPYGNPGTLVPGGDGVGLAASLRVLRPRPQLRGPAVRWGNAEVVSGRCWRVVLGHASATGVADAEPGGYRLAVDVSHTWCETTGLASRRGWWGLRGRRAR